MRGAMPLSKLTEAWKTIFSPSLTGMLAVSEPKNATVRIGTGSTRACDATPSEAQTNLPLGIGAPDFGDWSPRFWGLEP